MYYVAETGKLVADGVINPAQAVEIKHRARAAMIGLCVNTILIAGILAATLGLVFYLASPLSVAISGGLFLGVGLLILRFGTPVYRMFGNASALIGAGMLISGSGIELLDKYQDQAGPVMFAMGGIIAGLCAWRFAKALPHLRFSYGAVLLMGAAMHLCGAYAFANEYAYNYPDWIYSILHFYAFAVIAACGLLLDIRFVTALAIIPFAQMLDTGTGYFHAAYVFYSPEPTLSILQMAALIGLCLWAAHRWAGRIARNAGILAIMGFVVANLAFLVGSLWGDVIGETLWGPNSHYYYNGIYENWQQTQDAFKETTLVVSEHVFSVVWAVILVGLIAWAAMTNRRGLFNAGMTFAGIHAYTQMFESFYDQPLAYVIAGLTAIPLAFGLWRLNHVWFATAD